jgi:hypothetical protein
VCGVGRLPGYRRQRALAPHPPPISASARRSPSLQATPMPPASVAPVIGAINRSLRTPTLAPRSAFASASDPYGDARERQPRGLPILSTSNLMPPPQAIPSVSTATTTSVTPLYHLCLSVCGLRTAPTLTPPSSPSTPSAAPPRMRYPTRWMCCRLYSTPHRYRPRPTMYLEFTIWRHGLSTDDEDGAWMARDDLHWTYSAPLPVYRGRAHGANDYKIIRYASSH